MDVNSTGNSNKKTITSIQDIPTCLEPPTITNGELIITSITPVSSVGALQCIEGYRIGLTSPTSVSCEVGPGWGDISAMVCDSSSLNARGYYGTSFVTGFMQSTGSPTLMIACIGTATVRVEIPSLAIDEVHTVTSSITLTYSSTVKHTSSGVIEQKAVFVTSDKSIMIYGASFGPGSADGSVVIPRPALHSEYFIAGHPSTNAGTDEFVIISLSDATTITLDYNTIPLETITLNQNQTYYKAGIDLSGFRISASSPIFVLSGHECANIPDNSVLYCDYIDEVMPPVTSLGTSYIVTFMKPRADFTISVVITVDFTTVTIYDNNGNILETFDDQMRKNAIFRTYTGSKTISIVSNAPIMVHQYGHGSSGVSGDPSMMFIPDVGFYGEQYEFVIPSGFTAPCTLAIVISDTFSASSLTLNSQNFTPTQVIPVTVPGFGTYTVVYVDVQEGFNTLTYRNGVALFGAWVYGSATAVEFAWTLGYAT